ncbi:hypothetical protein B0H17DRAFT_1142545 [Mycena rosella]|uniref:Uncharacterized protein n=1 Tax=Mycena rosella TaxID=1033263 RepID=A0AAD7CWZ5_MYCRO|nr:hypothetical protein B0H17DRAFT_1142545 [Mycena rosella]
MFSEAEWFRPESIGRVHEMIYACAPRATEPSSWILNRPKVSDIQLGMGCRRIIVYLRDGDRSGSLRAGRAEPGWMGCEKLRRTPGAAKLGQAMENGDKGLFTDHWDLGQLFLVFNWQSVQLRLASRQGDAPGRVQSAKMAVSAKPCNFGANAIFFGSIPSKSRGSLMRNGRAEGTELVLVLDQSVDSLPLALRRPKRTTKTTTHYGGDEAWEYGGDDSEEY